MSDVNEWSAVEDGNTHLDQYDLEKQINPHSQLNRYTKKIMAAVRAKADAMQAEIDTLDDSAVHIDGDETVGGIKTFEEPIVGDVSVTMPMPEGVTPTPRLLTERFADKVNVKDFGAVGDGITDDTAAIQAAAAAGSQIYFPEGEYKIATSYNVDTGVVGYAPDINMTGPGKIIVNEGDTISGGDVVYDPLREIASFTPSPFARTFCGINYPPPQIKNYTGNCYVTVFSPSSALVDHSKHLKFVSAFGFGCGSAPIDWEMTDCFGSDAMIYAGYSSRNVAIGSESMAWGGAPNKQWLIDFQHDWWRKPASNPYFPGEAGWDAEGLETKFPGIGARIDAFTDYATQADDFAHNTACGRDAGCHIVRGYTNVFLGYRAAAHLFEGHTNIAIGGSSLHDAVFCDACVAVGTYAGRDNLDGSANTFLGHAAGRTVQGGEGAVIIGGFAADGTTTSASGAIVIGYKAGKSIANLDDCLYIGTSATVPAIGGDLAANKVGVNVAPADIRAQMHVKSRASGSSTAPTVAGLLVEGASSSAVTIECTGYGGLKFASATEVDDGGLTYGHSSHTLTVRANKTNVAVFGAAYLRPVPTDSSINLGGPSNLWKEVFAAAGTINTSDAREKESVTEPDEALLRAWSKVGFKLFKMKDAVASKGADAARLHAGVVAQEVADAFASEGLDASRYGLFCHDEWDAKEAEVDETGTVMEPAVEAGDRYGIRYAEALALECACLRKRLERIEARMEV